MFHLSATNVLPNHMSTCKGKLRNFITPVSSYKKPSPNPQTLASNI